MPANVNKATNKLAERSQLALWATNAAIWDWDLEKILIWSSPGNQILFGRGDEEILESFDIDAAADPWISHLHPDDRERVRQHLRDHLKHGTLYDVEYRYRLPGGEYIWVRSIGRAVRASDGSPTRMAGSNSDITSQKIAELETQHFREAVDNASEGIVLYDSNERFVYANKRYREMAPAIAHLLTPGTHREKMRQAYLSSGAISSDAETADVFMEEMRRSQSVGGTAEIRLTNGLWMKRSDHVLPDGGTVSVRTDITHIKQQEQALRESEARFRTIFEDAKFGIVVANADGLLFQCNRAFSEMLGFDPGELDGKSWPEITNPEDLAENRRLSDRLLRGEIAIYQMEKRFIRKDGGLLWTHLTVSTVGDDDEQPQLRLGMIEDISERRAAEEALSKSRSLLVQAQEMAHLGNWEIDYDKNTVTWSDEIYRLLGLKRLEFDGQQSTFLNYVHPEDRERLAQQAKGLRKGSDLDHTYRLLRPDGQERIVHVQGVVTSEIDGVPRQSRGFIQDITESKRADEALRASLAHLNRAQRIAHIGSWEYYERDKKLVWTDEVYRIFGVRKDEFECTRENVLELLHPEDRSTMIEARKRAEKGETDYSYDYRIIRPDGQTRNLRNVVLVIARDGDGVVRRAGTVQDVTERVAAEKALRESETHLSGAQRIAHIGSWIHNRRTEDLSWSDEVYRIFGTTKKEFRPSLDRVLQLVHPDDRSKIIAARERATISDTGNSFVYRIIRPSGEIRYVRQLSRDLEQEGGEAIRRAGTVQDITEQENAEEALRNSEARLAKAQEIAHLGSWELDVESGEERWSDEFYRVLGFERETHEAIFESIRKRIHPDDLDGMVEARERALHENQPFDHEFRIVLANGEIRHLHSMGQVTLKRAGMPARMSGTVQDITQRKKTEEALRDSEQMLRGIFETAAIGICANDEAGRYIKFNPAYQEMLGLTAEELSTKTFWDITHPEDQHLEEPHFADMLSGRVTSYQFEKRYIHKNGSIIWVSLNVADLKSVDGTVIGSIATVEDITERKRAEEALRKSEAHLKEAQRVAHIGSWEYDEQTNEFSWSDELFRITGVKKENFKPSYESFLEIIHPDDRDLLLEGRRRALAGENDDSLVFRLVHPDGEIRHVRRVAMTSAREDGKVIRRAGTAQDITEQVAAETALRESEARLMEAQEIANVGSWVSYFEGERLVRNVWSAQLCRIFGIELDAVPKDFEEYLKFVHEDDRDLVRRTLSLAIESDTPYEIEHRIVRPNGDVRYIYDKSRYVEEQTPGNKRLHGASSDITERKQAEEKRQQAQKMEAVGQLTGGVAHDFNNLLTVIMGNLELIRDTVGDDSALNNMIDRGIRASEHGAALTHRLLAFSRKQTLIPTEFNLGNVVAGMTEMLRRTLGEVIEIVNVGAGDIWPCRADQSQLEAALLNLALNARDAMSHGGRLTIETANISLIDHDSAAEVDVEPGDYVMLVVSDTGSGIAEEKLEHAFEPFFTTKEVGEGSGLGLSMVYGYAKQSGGNVMIFSNLGEGTTVKLYLPRSAVANDHVALKQAASAIPQSNREHILIVEDDADVRMLAVNVLSDLGYRVVEAGSAEAALDAVEHAAVPIDLLLSDVVLSGAMTGPELAAEVQRRNPAVKTVYMTGYAEEALNDDTARDERMHMILKPFKRVDLAKVIRCVLDDHGSRA